MTKHLTKSIWLNSTDMCSFQQIIEMSGLNEADLLSLVEADVLRPMQQVEKHYVFSSDSIVLARMAKRLQDDFELNLDGLILAVSLLQRIDTLEARLAGLIKKGR